MRRQSVDSGQGSLKYELKDPFYFRKRKLIVAVFIKQISIIAVLSGFFAVIACSSLNRRSRAARPRLSRRRRRASLEL